MKILLAAESRASCRDDLDRLLPAAEWVSIGPDGSLDGDPTGTEVIYWGADLWTEEVRLAPIFEQWDAETLVWVQGPSAGVDHPKWPELLDRGVRLTNASGIWAEPIAQYVIAWTLAWAQGLHGQILRSQHHDWTMAPADDLSMRTMGIIGHGGIGSACARVAHALGMRVVALRRTGGHDPHIDDMFTPDRLHELLETSDFVVLCAPYTDATRDMIGAEEFAAMGPQSVFINVARGELVDETAMAEALRRGVIRGATTDVTRTEPLPVDSPLWDVPNLVITPHQSGEGPRGQERLDALFLDNLGRFVRGEPLINEVTDTGITH
jgi:phosphoglycerate dehydrogenase-like enzyme